MSETKSLLPSPPLLNVQELHIQCLVASSVCCIYIYVIILCTNDSLSQVITESIDDTVSGAHIIREELSI